MTAPSISAWQQLLAALESAWPSKQYLSVGVVVGCSGGADSVALLHALVQIQSQTSQRAGFVVTAHFNHGLRGRASEEDAEYVCQLARQLGSPFELENATRSTGDEASLREDRYAFFQRVLRKTGARYLALAHSADDNVETFLHRLMRGTGPGGLTGIPAFRPLTHDSDFVIARPLIGCRRDLIRSALLQQGLEWREDESNQDVRYTRNWIRNRLLPEIEVRYPSINEAVLRAIEGQQEWARCIATDVESLLQRRLLHRQPIRWSISDEDPDVVVIEACRRIWREQGWPMQAMTREHWQQLAELLAGRNRQILELPGKIRASRLDDQVELISVDPEP
ncbi:MAG: tRNA lysidine(34) synthetase TilS [Planctomycetota bacterium]